MSEDYLKELEAALNAGRRPIELLTIILGFLNFSRMEIKMYKLLQQTPLTVKQIAKKLEISERTVRKYVKILYQKGFIVRRIVEEKRLKYVYEAIPIRKAWAKLKRDIGRIMTEIGKTLRTIT